MSNSKVFSGPPSNKATAATIAAATATLFWTIAAHTFWKHMSKLGYDALHHHVDGIPYGDHQLPRT